MEKFCFIILHYGDKTVTQKCIDSILKLKNGKNISIVLVDNDGTKTKAERQKLKSFFEEIDERIRVLTIKENYGFSYANNMGYIVVKKEIQPDYVIVANNDIVFGQEDFLRSVHESYVHNRFVVLGPDIIQQESGFHQNPLDYNLRSKKQVDRTIFLNHIALRFFEVIFPFVYLYNKWMKKKKVDMCQHVNRISHMMEDFVPCGACIILSKKFIDEEEKVFSPETAFYYEEYLLYYKCKKNGYRIVYDPNIQVVHGDGVATANDRKTEKRKTSFIVKNTLESARIYRAEVYGNNSVENR
ncbi:MAG: glycosyltransferase [Lachnospiraceae bacterium]|nr:glycosyltransferase [Lachnospiraceae bacterium]